MTSFGQCLKDIRVKRGLSQKELAEMSGVSNFMISWYERGHGEPQIVSLVCLADALKVTTDSLLGREVKYDKRRN